MTTYSDDEIKGLDLFARAVIEAVKAEDPRQLYASTNRQAYQQYFAEVYNNLSGMRDDPRLFFESDLAMRRQWGAIIAADKARYDAEVLAESTQATTEPDSVKELREQLEQLKAQITSITPLAAPVNTEPEGETAEES